MYSKVLSAMLLLIASLSGQLFNQFVPVATNAEFGSARRVAIGSEGTIFLANYTGGMLAIEYNGNSLSETAHIYNEGTFRDVSVGLDNTIFTAEGNDGLGVYTYDGNTFVNATRFEGLNIYNVEVGAEGTIFGATSGGLHAFLYDGVSVSNIASIVAVDQCVSGLAVGTDGTIFTRCIAGGISAYTYDANGFTLIAQINDGGWAYDITLGPDNTIFLANTIDGLRAYSFDGSALTNIGHIDPGATFAVTVAPDGIIYTFNYILGLIAYTFNGSTFSEIAQFDEIAASNFSRYYDLAIGFDGSLIFANDTDGLLLYEFEDEDFTQLAHTPTGGFASELALGTNGSIFLANHYDGLRAYTFDGTSFLNTAHVNDRGRASGIALNATGTIFLANYRDGLRAYEYDGFSFQNVGHYSDVSTGRGPVDIAVGPTDPERIFVAHDAGGLIAFSYSYQNQQFNFHAHIDEGGTQLGVAVNDDGVIFSANDTDGLRAYIYDDNTYFTGVAHIDDGGNARSVTVGPDGTIFLANGSDGLRAYSFDGASFTLVGHVNDGNGANSVFVRPDGIIFLANGSDGLRAYSYDGSSFSIIAHLGKNSVDVVATNYNIFAAHGYAGLSAYRYEDYSPDTTLRAKYQFSGNVDDLSGNQNHAFVNGAEVCSDRFGNPASAYYFDGEDDFMHIPNSPSLNIQTGESFTISCWFRHGSINENEYILSKYSGESGISPSYAFGSGASGNAYSSYEYEPGNSIVNQGTNNLYDGTWHNYVSVYESGVSTSLYIDGVLVDTDTTSYSGSMANSLDVYIGRAVNASQFFNGEIDDIDLYKHALSSSKIDSLFAENGMQNEGIKSVPFEYLTIQSAIDAASVGDSIIVHPGTYFENINFNGKDIVLGSLFLITQDTSYIPFTVIDGQQSGSVVTFSNQESDSAILTGFTIQNGSGDSTESVSSMSGGGVFITNAAPTIKSCIIRNNNCELGSGVFVHHGQPTIQKCRIENNSYLDGEVTDQTSAVWTGWSQAIFDSCLIQNNNGHGIYSYACSGNWTNSWIISNTGNGFSRTSNESFENLIIDSNGGHGIGNLREAGLFHSQVTRNGGYGIGTVRGVQVPVDFCTVANNGTWGLYGWNGSLRVSNSIIHNNASGSREIFGDSVFTYTYSDISDTLLEGTGNESADPKFQSPNTGNFRIYASSICINSAHPDSLDNDGTRADMGAHPYLIDYAGSNWLVSTEGSDLIGMGSVDNPFASIQAGINFCDSADTVLVASGTYQEHVDFLQKNIGLVSLEGSANTVIDGGGTGRPVTIDNASQILQRIAGFTIQNGHEYTGAGIKIIRSDMEIQDVHLISNVATYQGGGLYSEYSNLTISSLQVHGNSASSGGGGLYLYETTANCENLLGYSNSSDGNGGMLHLHFGNLVLTHATCVFNSAMEGSVVYARLNSNLEIYNSIAWFNDPWSDLFYEDESSTLNVNFSNVQGGYDGMGNLNANPRFTNQGSHNFALRDQSLCIGAASESVLFTNLDIEGNPRPNPEGSNPDMGAYENPLAGPSPVIEVQNLDIGGSENIYHLTNHNPNISYHYHNSFDEPLEFYQIQVSSVYSFSVIDKWDTEVVTAPDTIVPYAGSSLLDGETYYMRARAGSGDVWSDWAYQLSFRMNSEPLAPTLLAPVDNVVIDENIILIIASSLDAETDSLVYKYYIYDDVTREAYIDSSDWISDTTWQSFATLDDNAQYWWYAKASDSFEEGALSIGESFLVNTENSPPDLFVLLTPTDSTEVTNLTPSFHWSPASDPDPGDQVNYTLVLENPQIGVQEFDTGSDTSIQTVDSLIDNTIYFWQVIASDLQDFETVNDGGYDAFAINLYNDPPLPSNLISPDSNVVFTPTPSFFWEASIDPDPFESLDYEVHWWYEGGEWDSILTVETNATITDSLEENQQYFWQIISMDDEDGLAQSENKTFWVDYLPQPPAQFSLTTPDSGSSGNNASPILSWQEAIDPDPFENVAYSVEIALDSLFSDVVYNANVLMESHQTETALPIDTRYWWRVTAQDEDSLFATTNIWAFDVGYVATDQGVNLPTEFTLEQNFPNPFNPSTTIRYGLPEDADVTLVIYDIRGNVVRLLVSGQQHVGWYEHNWNGRDDKGHSIGTGLYLARIQAGEYTKVIKMIFIK